jgi:hypothetical protein
MKRANRRNNLEDLYLNSWFAGDATDLNLGGNCVEDRWNGKNTEQVDVEITDSDTR